MREKVQAIIERIRPMLQEDGGDVELVAITAENVVQVRMTGACKGCPKAKDTLRNVISRVILKELPEVQKVEAV